MAWNMKMFESGINDGREFVGSYDDARRTLRNGEFAEVLMGDEYHLGYVHGITDVLAKKSLIDAARFWVGYESVITFGMLEALVAAGTHEWVVDNEFGAVVGCVAKGTKKAVCVVYVGEHDMEIDTEALA